MLTAEQFRTYAEECKRIAQTLPPAQRVQMLDMAKAWMDCADEADRRAAQRAKGGP